MAGTRALPDLVARLRVDSSGVDSAVMSLIHSFGKADLAIAGVAAGLGILVVAGKSMIDIAEKHAAAESNLAQAIASRNDAHAKTPPNLAEVEKATKALATAQRQLAEFDVGHHGSSGTAARGLTQLDKMHRQDIQNRIAQARSIGALTAAQRQLQEFDVGHQPTAGRPATGLSQSEQMHRQDIVAKVVAAQKAVAAAHTDVARQEQSSTINEVKLRDSRDRFLVTNRKYISDQSEVTDGYAKLTRAGLSQIEVEKDMGRALDISALKHISLSDAVDLVNNAEHGRLRGLIDLGITTSQYTDAQGNLIRGSKDVARAMGELDNKTKGGRKTLSELQQDTNVLSNDWQDLSNKGGPVLLTLIDNVVKAVTGIYNEFDKIGHDDAMWGAISDRLVKMASWIHDWILGPLGQVGEYISGAPITYPAPAGAAKGSAPNVKGKGGNRAGGGPVLPGGVYTIGEDRPETLVMDPRGGGYVIPHASGSRGGGRMVVLPVVFSPIPPNREQMLFVRDYVRRLDRAQR